MRLSCLHHPSRSVNNFKFISSFKCYIFAGWIGYSNETLTELCEKYLELGFTAFKLKVGKDFHDDVRRLQAVRNVIGWENKLVCCQRQLSFCVSNAVSQTVWSQLKEIC